MKIKAGDEIEVIDGRPYSVTKEGSLGIVSRILLNGSVIVRFHKLTGPGGFVPSEFSIRIGCLKILSSNIWKGNAQ